MPWQRHTRRAGLRASEIWACPDTSNAASLANDCASRRSHRTVMPQHPSQHSTDCRGLYVKYRGPRPARHPSAWPSRLACARRSTCDREAASQVPTCASTHTGVRQHASQNAVPHTADNVVSTAQSQIDLRRICLGVDQQPTRMRGGREAPLILSKSLSVKIATFMSDRLGNPRGWTFDQVEQQRDG